MLQDASSCHRVCDHVGQGVDLEVRASLQVNDEARISEEVREPVPRTRGAGDEEPALDIEHPDLDSTRFA
jgi:hypothetical protein